MNKRRSLLFILFILLKQNTFRPSVCYRWWNPAADLHRRWKDTCLTRYITDWFRGFCAFLCINQSSHLLWHHCSTKQNPDRAASLIRWFTEISLTLAWARVCHSSVIHGCFSLAQSKIHAVVFVLGIFFTQLMLSRLTHWYQSVPGSTLFGHNHDIWVTQ